MAKIKGMSIFAKTGLLALCLFGAIATLASILLAHTLYDRLTKEYLSKGTAIVQSIAGASQDILLNRDAATVQAMIDQYLEIEGVAYVFVMDADRVVVSHTFVPEMPELLTKLHHNKSGQRVDEVVVPPYGRVIDICQPILAGVAGYVHVGMDKELIIDYFWEAVIEMQSLMLIVLVLCVIILYLATREISRPLKQLTEYADRLASHDFSATIEITSSDEVGQLGRTMQVMADELATLFANMESEVTKATGDLKEHMVYLSAIIDNLVDGLLVVSPTGTVTVLNPSMRELFDLGDEDYDGLGTREVFPSGIAELTEDIRACTTEVRTAEIPLSKGRTGKAVGSSICVDAPSEQCLGGVVLIRDITREKELDKLKTEFISTVSHELRTPMTSVVGFAKLIRKKLEGAIFPALSRENGVDRSVVQVQENVEIIVSEAERLTELINDVLDIAKMEAGEMRWRDQVVFMSDILRQSVDSTRGMWKSKGLEVRTQVEEGVPAVRGDRARLVQVMVNLISNAVKFTEEGPIICRVHTDGSYILVSVEDKGVGIPRKAQTDIFDKFKQVGDTLTDKPTGTGLGLPICRQIVEHHGGRIWVESEEGEGSVFSFNLPAARVQPDDSDEEIKVCDRYLPGPDTTMLVRDSGESAGKPLILVADDDPSLNRYLRQVLEEEGFRVMVAVNGVEAVEMARDFMPHLITMDLMMPGMDGETAIKCLRNNPFTRNIPILVLSALTDGVSAGGDVALTKPVDDVRLVEVVRALLLEKDLRRDCMVLGEEEDLALDGLSVICPDNVVFRSPEVIWKDIEDGFRGTILIPSELDDKIDMKLLSKLPDIAVVILPNTGLGESES